MTHDYSRGMTLIETLVAITILTVAIIAPMSLTIQSLASALYARDQVVASNLAQEAIEGVRAVRDGNILRIALNLPDPACTPTNLLCGIPIGQDFTIDTRDNTLTSCLGTCGPLETNVEQSLYGYDSGWLDTPYTRTLHAEFVDETEDEIRLAVTVEWRSGSFAQTRSIILYENLYRWVADGSGI